MTLKIEVGKLYRTRNGRKVGPMRLGRDANSTSFKWAESHDDEGAWDDEGDYGLTHLCGNHSRDLIAEWTDEPESTYNDADGLAYHRQNTPKPYLAPFNHNQRLAIEPIANGGWLVSAVSPCYGQETERLGAFGSAADMLSALHDALTVSNGGDA